MSATTASAMRPLRLAGRIALLALLIVGAVVAAPSGLGLFLFLPYASVGGLLVIRRPRMSIGWLLLGLAASFASIGASLDATIQQFADGTVAAPMAIFALFLHMSGVVSFFLFGILALVFPSGGLPTGRWGTVSRLAVASVLLFLTAALVMPNLRVQLVGYPETVLIRNPIALLPDLAIWQVFTPDTTTYLAIMLLLVVAAISLVVRARSATGVERQQLRWFSASIAFNVAAILAGMALFFLVPGLGVNGLVWIPAEVAFASVPISVGIAVLRYHLYEIDRIISRTLSYAVVSVALAAVFVGVVLGMQAVLAPITGDDTVAVAASTLIVAALFQPLRRRVKTVVDRRFNRARYDAQRLVEAFSVRLRDEVDIGTVTDDLDVTITSALNPSTLGMWLRGASNRTAG